MFTQLILDWSSIINYSYAKDDNSVSETHFSSLNMSHVSHNTKRETSHVVAPQLQTEYKT
jgi:hypothetical protein